MVTFELYYLDETKRAPKVCEDLFNQTFEHLATKLSLKGHYCISVTIVSLDKIQEINRLYRQLDKPTDVISFAYQESDSFEAPIIDLGELCISLDVAITQASEYVHPLLRELCFLFIHGTLHLLGYDHVHNVEEETIMFNLQNDILNTLEYDFGKEDK